MSNTSECTYTIVWRTCREKPIVQDDTERLLRHSLAKIATINGLKIKEISVHAGGREVAVTVSTDNTDLSPNSIAYMLRHKTGGVIRRSKAEFQKLPAIWTSEYRLWTTGNNNE